MGKSADLTDKFATKTEVKGLRDLMTLVNIVLFIGFAGAFIAVGGMVTSSLADKQATSQAMRDEVQTQNGKIEELTEQTKELTEQLKQLTKVQQDVQKTLQTTN